MAVDFLSSGVPLIRLSGLKPGADLLEGCNYLDPDKVARKWVQFRVLRGDVLLSSSASLGEIATVDEEAEGAVPYTGIIAFRPAAREILPAFVGYLLRAPDFKLQIEAMGVGSVIRHFGPMHLRRMTVSYPDLSSQRAIAEVLTTLDNKIAANSAVAKTSDSLVRAEFEGNVAASQELRRVDSLVSAVRAAADPRRLPGLPYIGLEHIPRRQLWISNWSHAGEVSSGKTAFAAGDVLFGKLRPYFHKVVLAPVAGLCSTDILVCRPSEPVLAGFALAALASDAVVERCAAASAGTRMPRTNWADLGAIEVPWPGFEAAASLAGRVMKLAGAVAALFSESRLLADLRDTLLPELMSGRLRVKDAEKRVEAVV
jgi:type I restriction enzyme S subunit